MCVQYSYVLCGREMCPMIVLRKYLLREATMSILNNLPAAVLP